MIVVSSSFKANYFDLTTWLLSRSHKLDMICRSGSTMSPMFHWHHTRLIRTG